MFSIATNTLSFIAPSLSPELLKYLIELDNSTIWIKSGSSDTGELIDFSNITTKRPDPGLAFEVEIKHIASKSIIPQLLQSFTYDRYPLCELDEADKEVLHLSFIEPKIDESLTEKIENVLKLAPSLVIRLDSFLPCDSDEYTIWDKRFFKIAEEVSTWSKDPGTKVGCVLVDDNKRILSTGYNGFPAGFNDSLIESMSRDKKLAFTIHAEVNAIINAAKNGVNIEGSTAYVTFHPCTNCISALINAGITIIFCPDFDCFRPNPNGQFSFQTWLANFKKAQDFLTDDIGWYSAHMNSTFIKYSLD